MEFRILGPLEAAAGGRAVELPRGRARALLAILLLRRNQVVAADRLIDDLWAGGPPPTAAKMVQMHVAELRRALGDGAVRTSAPGYELRVDGEALDLARFETLVADARGAGAAARAQLLRQALELWRGPPLAEFVYEAWAQPEIARLDELRLGSLEDLFEAELADGRAAELVSELETLAREHPFRDRLGAQLMTALYRAGRQADALEHYRRTRSVLLEELGLEPSPLLQGVERAILTHDASLDATPAATVTPGADLGADLAAPGAAILVVPRDPGNVGELLELAEPLARSSPPRELIVARVVGAGETGSLADASAELAARRAELVARGVSARVAVFTSPSPGPDVARLACEHEVDLVLADVGRSDPLGGDVAALVEAAPSDIALHVGGGAHGQSGAPVAVPFGGAEHDWAALELGAWIARAHGVGLTLLGSASRRERRDASRLLADASLLVQKTAGVVAEPRLTPSGADAMADAAAGATLLVVGLSERWREEGVGPFRLALVENATTPVLLVRRGPRPGGLAPAGSRTRYTWSLADALPAD